MSDLIPATFAVEVFFDLIIWPHGQAVKTSPFHGGNRGPNPLGVIVIDCEAIYYVRNCPLNEDAVAFEVRTVSS